MSGAQTVLFVDEVHRFSKAQQDALLPAVENRWVTLIARDHREPVLLGDLAAAVPLAAAAPCEPLTDDDVAGGARPRAGRRARARRRGHRSTRTPPTTWSGWPAATPAGR